MRVRWTESAARDLATICDYIEEHDGAEAARTVALRIYARSSSLPQFPHVGRPGRKKGTRELVIYGSPFLAIADVTAEGFFPIPIPRLLWHN